MNKSLKTLGEICDIGAGEIRTGPFGSQLHQSDYKQDGIPVVMPKDIWQGKISENDIARISEYDVSRLSQHKLLQNDIIYGRRGDIGRHAIINGLETGWLCGTGCLRIRLGNGPLDPTFLHYYLNQKKVIKWIYNQAIGATMPNLNTSILRSVPVEYPALPVQRKIAAVLSAYDDLIENNTRRIAILEEMTRLLYREWFVRFRFPGHEHLKLVDSPLGHIPEGWEVKKFTDLAEVLSGGTPKTKVKEYWDGSIPFFAPKDYPGQFYILDTEKRITNLGVKKCNSKFYEKETVFITARGTVGKVVLTATGMAMNQSCYALLGKNGISQIFIFLLTLQSVEYLKRNTGGATFDTIVVDTFQRFNVVKPPNQLIESFSQLTRPVFDYILNLLRRNSKLCTNRNLLLPKLISGEVDVSDLEIQISEVETAA